MALTGVTLDRGKGIVRDDQFPIRRNVYGIPASDTVAEAWLTVKADKSDADGAATFQKIITTSNVAGTGHVENDGTNGTAELRFDILQADTAAMTADTTYYYDIQIRLNTSNDILTIEVGTVVAIEEITQDQ